MESIAYQDAVCQAQASPSLPAPDEALVRQFWNEAKRQIVTGDYLRRKWQPLCGVRFYGLVRALRAHCSYEIKDGEAMCFPSEETLARECGVTRRTIINWFQRSPEGRFARKVTLPTGEVRWEEWNWSALNHFLRIVPQLRYDPVGKRSVKTSNRYFIRMDDPPIPEDMPLIWAKARELARAHLESQAKAQEQEARRQEFEARIARAAAFGTTDFTYNNGKKVPTEQWEKSAQDRLCSPSLINFDFHRSTQEGESAKQAICNTMASADQQANKMRGNEENAESAASASKSNGATAPRSENQFRSAVPLPCMKQEEGEARFQAAWDAAGGIISSLLEEYGDAPAVARRDAFKVLRASLALGAPIEQIGPLAYLARERVKAFEMRGGRILKTRAGFYVSTACNLAHEARKKGWNVERIKNADQAKPVRKQEQQGTSRSARRGERRPTRPSSAEIETLALELGQQEETYAYAQAQLQQMAEAREASEEHRLAAPAQGTAQVDRHARQVWQSTLERIEAKISPATFVSWFKGTSAVSLQDGLLTVQTANTFSRSHLETRFTDLVCSILFDLVGPDARVRFVVEGEEHEADEAPSEVPPSAPPTMPRWHPEWEQLEYRAQVVKMAEALGWPDWWGTLADKPPTWRKHWWWQFLLDEATTAQQAAEAYEWLRPQFQA